MVVLKFISYRERFVFLSASPCTNTSFCGPNGECYVANGANVCGCNLAYLGAKCEINRGLYQKKGISGVPVFIDIFILASKTGFLHMQKQRRR